MSKSKTLQPNYSNKGLALKRYFSRAGEDPLQVRVGGGRLEYELREAIVEDDEGKEIYRQKNVEVPATWSQHATNMMTGKYFHGELGSAVRERSTKQVFTRVADFIRDRGIEQGYFRGAQEAQVYRDELLTLMANQFGAFNSPMFFNAGIFDKYGIRSGGFGSYRLDHQKGKVVALKEGEAYKFPQGAACFIKGINDNLNDLMAAAYDEAMIFKQGSGIGGDLSRVRSMRERLSGGGVPSGPLSFMDVYDTVARVVKSGGKTRRAARMQTLGVWHPDIMEFIKCKEDQENLLAVLAKGGVPAGFGTKARENARYQNTNISVRITDEFMRALRDGREWRTIPVNNRELADKMPVYKAKEIFDAIAYATWVSGDPGMQFHDTINRWHTCKRAGEIRSSNPCSEFMEIDDSSCNLASLNLVKFLRSDGTFDHASYKKAAEIFFIGQDIIVDSTSYPSEKIVQNAHDLRPLGLGYANLGALLMRKGLPYDSDEGRAFAGTLTALLSGHAYRTSSRLAQVRGTFNRYNENEESMLEVLLMHQAELDKIDQGKLKGDSPEVLKEARAAWDSAIKEGRRYGFRNAQTTVLAPTGTIGFIMDCDTTGIEPDVALVKRKKLAGGGSMRIVNQSVAPALTNLGYSSSEVGSIVEYLDKNATIEGAPGLKQEHLPIFDCSLAPKNGTEKRSVHYNGHLAMMTAAQPFLSGAISKTVNMPKNCTPEDIANVYKKAYDLGLKAVAVFRDESKGGSQPVSSGNGETLEVKVSSNPGSERVKMPSTAYSIRKKFTIGMGNDAHEGYIHAGMDDKGMLRELFLTMGSEGSTVAGFADAFSTAISLGLQYGIPLPHLVSKFQHTRFPPSGIVLPEKVQGALDKVVESPHAASSPVGYVFQWLNNAFPEGKWKGNGVFTENKEKGQVETQQPQETAMPISKGTGLTCPKCHGPATPYDRCGSTKCLSPTCGEIVLKACGE